MNFLIAILLIVLILVLILVLNELVAIKKIFQIAFLESDTEEVFDEIDKKSNKTE